MVVKTYSKDGGTKAPSANEQLKARDLGTTGSSTKTSTKKTNRNKLPKRTYTVKTGDTLGSIAEKTGIPVVKLQELNPSLDPQALSTGQKVKLRE